MNWLKDPTRLGEWVFLALLFLAALFVLLSLPARSDPVPEPPAESLQQPPAPSQIEAHITARIRTFVTSPCRGRASCERLTARSDPRWSRAPELARLIVTEAQARDLDPYLAAILVESESSYRESGPEGARGEVGLLQVWGVAASQATRAGHDLSTSAGQIRAGLDRLARARDRCGPEPLALLTDYQTGVCRRAGGHPGPTRRLTRLDAWRASLAPAPAEATP